MKKVAILFVLYWVASTVLAQSTATIKGSITDKANGEGLVGANVIIIGTNMGTASDALGNYTITNVKPGEYNVEVTFMGYEKVMQTGIKVKAGQVLELNFQLGESVNFLDDEVVIIGEKPLVDVEQSQSEVKVGAEKISAGPARNIQSILSTQAGVINTPSGVHIRGGRTYETGFYIDGVSAQDPLTGTGFGVDLGSNAIDEVSVTTGGSGAEFGNSTSGVVNTKTKSGGDKLTGYVSYSRDNFAFNKNWNSVFNHKVGELNLGGPMLRKLTKNKLRFYTSARYELNDLFIKHPANQLHSSWFNSTFWMPSQDNRWSGLIKLDYKLKPTQSFTVSYLRSINVNQDLNSLRITTNNPPFTPGYQYEFYLQPDNATTFAHDKNLLMLRWNHSPSNRFAYTVTASRLFASLRADANGRPWRPDNVDTEYDPKSIVDFPATYFNPGDEVAYVNPGPGLYNNNGISTTWHHHYFEELAIKFIGNLYSKDTKSRLQFGYEHKRQNLEWIDISRPWIGAPITLADGSKSQSYRLGESSEIWKASPENGAFFFEEKYTYLGLILRVGGRMEYWFPGSFVDKSVADPNSPIRDEIRQGYYDQTIGMFGQRMKMRFLPKVSASFPIQENMVMHFNYNHSMRLPHPTQVYTGLNPYYTDRSTLSRLGNPNLNPEVNISYEVGLKSQLTNDDALSVTAYWQDRYDFITYASIQVPDFSGRDVTRSMPINSDFVRTRGVEITYIKRINKWFNGQVSAAFARVTGQSSSSSETLNDILNNGNRQNTKEYPMPWDCPVDLKWNALFRCDNQDGLFNKYKNINHFKLYIEGVYRSGRRYTPYTFIGNEKNSGRPIYEIVSDPNMQNSLVGKHWFWMDVTFQKWWTIKNRYNITWKLEVTNILNNKNAAIINPITGQGYQTGDDVPSTSQDPRFIDPRDYRSYNLPPNNPARWLPQRHFLTGIQFHF
ncbi:TonB-dependent receptor plug domain-containing protein [bacterium]|nr:TonB-dependent receptor plug domain-containing protein [bacterium]